MALSKEEIAARYGIAIFDYVRDAQALGTVHAELFELKKAVSDNPRLINVLSDPILNSDDKQSILTVIAEKFSQETQNILNLLLEYNRFPELIEIIDYFGGLYDQTKLIKSGIAISAMPLDDEQLARLGAGYAQKYGLSDVQLENKVDSSILGGVVLQVGDRMIDGSVKNKLKKIRAQLISKD